jgi:hypothetical protein
MGSAAKAGTVFGTSRSANLVGDSRLILGEEVKSTVVLNSRVAQSRMHHHSHRMGGTR